MRLLSLPACLKLNPAPFASCYMNQDITAEGATQSSGQQQSLGGSPASEQSSLQQKWRLFKVSNPMPCSAKFPPPPPQRSLHNLRPPHPSLPVSRALSRVQPWATHTCLHLHKHAQVSSPHAHPHPALPWVFLSAGNSFPGSAGPGHLSERFPPTRTEEFATPRDLTCPSSFSPPNSVSSENVFPRSEFFPPLCVLFACLPPASTPTLPEQEFTGALNSTASVCDKD